MEPVLVALREGRPARTAEIDPQLRPRLNQLQLMTAKPVLYVCNVEEASAATGNALSAKVAEKAAAEGAAHVVRSEEHTSELQSLMRISYAVFCLKKTKNISH